MSDFQDLHVGKTCTYQCDDCGKKAESQPMPPKPALGLYGLPTGWKLGLRDTPGDSPLYCETCEVEHDCESLVS